MSTGKRREMKKKWLGRTLNIAVNLFFNGFKCFQNVWYWQFSLLILHSLVLGFVRLFLSYSHFAIIWFAILNSLDFYLLTQLSSHLQNTWMQIFSLLKHPSGTPLYQPFIWNSASLGGLTILFAGSWSEADVTSLSYTMGYCKCHSWLSLLSTMAYLPWIPPTLLFSLNILTKKMSQGLY